MNLRFWTWGQRRVQEALTRDDDRGWRPAGPLAATALDPERDELNGPALLEAAYQAYTLNPLGKEPIEQTTNFVLGDGAKVVAKDPRVQKVIDVFWNDPENDMAMRVFQIQTELCLYGEQFIRFFVDQLTGRVLIRQLDPLYVVEVETDPNDLEKKLRYLYRPPASGLGSGSVEGQWIDAKDVLHVAINKVSSARRGRSDLTVTIPWIRRYTRWLENRCRLNELLTNILYDVTVHGAGPEEVARHRAMYAKPPPPATVLVHNEKEQWKQLVPEVHANDAEPDGRAIRLMVATGAGVPEHFLSEGGNANRATAAEMGKPAIKRFRRRQAVFRTLLAKIVNRILDEAQRVGKLGPRVNRSFEIELEEIAEETPRVTGEELHALARGLAIALKEGLTEKDQAKRLWERFVGVNNDGTDSDVSHTSTTPSAP